MACQPLKDSLFDCATREQAGTDVVAYYTSWDAWKKAAKTSGAKPDDVITSIVNATGEQFYKITTSDPSGIIAQSNGRVVDTGVDGFDHSVQINIHDRTQAMKNALVTMKYKRVVMVVKQLTGKYQVFGSGIGLKLNPSVSNLSDPTTGNVIIATFATPTTTGPELDFEQELFDTDEATTDALMEGLLTTGV